MTGLWRVGCRLMAYGVLCIAYGVQYDIWRLAACAHFLTLSLLRVLKRKDCKLLTIDYMCLHTRPAQSVDCASKIHMGVDRTPRDPTPD
jgi:hypothetical protein